jgi:sec-independent protein translocase protein TatA
MISGLGVWEIGLILLIVMLFFGAKKIPVIGRGLGEGIRNFKGALSESDDSSKDRTLEEPTDSDKP